MLAQSFSTYSKLFSLKYSALIFVPQLMNASIEWLSVVMIAHNITIVGFWVVVGNREFRSSLSRKPNRFVCSQIVELWMVSHHRRPEFTTNFFFFFSFFTNFFWASIRFYICLMFNSRPPSSIHCIYSHYMFNSLLFASSLSKPIFGIVTLFFSSTSLASGNAINIRVTSNGTGKINQFEIGYNLFQPTP